MGGVAQAGRLIGVLWPPSLDPGLNPGVCRSVSIKRIEDHGADVETSTPEQLGALVKSELAKWRGVVQKARLTAD
jgi:hypothetical protein